MAGGKKKYNMVHKKVYCVMGVTNVKASYVEVGVDSFSQRFN